MMQQKRILTRLIVFLSMLVFLSACNNTAVDNDTAEDLGSGKVRFIHSASSTDELDVAYRGLTDGLYYALSYATTYGHQYGYYDFNVGTREITVVISGTNIAVASGEFTVEEDGKYTFIAYDNEATINPELYTIQDTTTSAEPQKSLVRFIHLGAEAFGFGIYEKGNNTAVTDLEYLEQSGYINLDAGTYEFEIKSKDSGQTVLSPSPITFLSEQNYTIIFSGSISDLTPVEFNVVIYRETSI